MTTAIGVVMTEHIVAGRLEDLRLKGALLRYPAETDELDALIALPASELVELLANQIATLAATRKSAVTRRRAARAIRGLKACSSEIGLVLCASASRPRRSAAVKPEATRASEPLRQEGPCG